MDNPWATTWEQPDDGSNNRKKPISTPSWTYTVGSKTQDQEEDIGLPSWSASNNTQLLESSHTSDALWTPSIDDSGAWGSSTYAKINFSRQRITEAVIHSETDEGICPVPAATTASEEDNAVVLALPDSVEPHPVLLAVDPTFPVPDSPDVDGGFEAGASVKDEEEETEDDGEAWADPINLSTDDGDDWGTAWVDTSAPEVSVSAEEPPDEWESARQEKEKLNRAVPPEMMAALVQKCQEVSGELWPGTESDSDASNWRTGFDGLENITILLNDLVPEDMALSPPTPFSQTATAKAVNNALKLTRHMPLTRKSPMALLLSSKGSTDWEKSIKARKDIPVDDTPVGWRILEKDERAAFSDATHPKKPGAGLLSFWNRKASSSIPSADAKVENARPSPISARSSIENTKPQVSEKRDISPARTPAVFMPSSPVVSSSAAPDVVIPVVTPAPSAVSRFLNRFSRAKGTGSERKSIALSTDDLDFLSDIVPSAHDPDDGTDDAQLKALSSLINSNPTPLPTKLPPPLAPPPIAPPPKPSSVNTSRPPSVGLSGLGITLEPARGSPQHTSARSLFPPPPLSPQYLQNHLHQLMRLFSAYTNPIIPPAIPSLPQPSSRTHSPFQLPPPPKAPSALSIPPLLPPPVSPPQTPRPSAHPMLGATSFTSSPSTDWAAATYQDDDDDDSFSAFSTLPRTDPFPAPRESMDSSLNSPSSTQALNSAKSSTSMSFDDFDDFVTSSRIRTPSPPPVPAKPSKVVGAAAAAMPSSQFGTSIHIRTQSLLDHAATQRGQWPSPVNAHPRHSMLPSPSTSPSLGRDLDLLSDSGAALSAPKFGSPPPKVLSTMVPQLSPSPPPAPLSQPLLSFASLSPSSRAERPPAKSVQTGGLTAQDLSFFEGL
ncbi:hypothetical protein DFJ58DRAFT_754951 [Suillus subalutaceus]|uniref:uncharacterized protein n=1 Tax=Suillus subalutaceus TaxID=48586 RepID=UPI001B88254A|nr:uncharacterized protein DFJ58DRAFT_754951 [Suillus subalutaceus]KAG1876564.1 hypothetical protein DFJ58DRAFT_754951 [Suillus subalutaceus]